MLFSGFLMKASNEKVRLYKQKAYCLKYGGLYGKNLQKISWNNPILTRSIDYITEAKVSLPDKEKVIPKYNPFNAQAGGKHYKDKGIQPVQYAQANNLNFCQTNVIKYITRHPDKNRVEDLFKAIHCTLLEAYHKYPEDYDNLVERVKGLLV